jgi:outer membrane receptor protein involved in Fe transport
MIKLFPIRLLLILSISAATLANDELDDLFSISLGELSQLVITGATMHEESLRSVPASVTVYSKEEIRQLGITRLSELMNYVPGFQSQRNDRSSTSDGFSARGVRFDGTGREVLILLDGQRLNADWEGGAGFTTAMIDLYTAKRVEFIRGPSSPLYGSNAFIGIVSITTGVNNEVDVSLADHGQYQASFSNAYQFDKGSVELSAKKIDDQGVRLMAYDPLAGMETSVKDPYEFANVHFKTKYENSSLIYHYNQITSEEFYMGGYVSNEKNYIKGVSQFVYVDHKFTFPKKWILTSSLSYSKYRFDLASVVSTPIPFISIDGEIEERESKVKFVLTQSLKSGKKNVMGIEWREPEIVDSDATFSGDVNADLPQAPLTSRTILGVFAQHQNYISDDMHYVVGARFDDYSNFGSHVAPRAGLVWEYNEFDTLKFLYGESFRAPGRSETDVINSAALVANPDLKPEIARTIETVWLHQPKDLSFSVTGFYTELSDVIINLPVSPIERINAGNEEMSGIEIELENLWTQYLTSRINASWIINDLDNVSSEASVFTGGSLIYDYHKLQTSLLVNYHSSKQDSDISINGYREVPSRTFVDMNLRYEVSKNIEWHTKLHNIFDEEYLSVASSKTENTVGVPNRGFSIVSGVRVNF